MIYYTSHNSAIYTINIDTIIFIHKTFISLKAQQIIFKISSDTRYELAVTKCISKFSVDSCFKRIFSKQHKESYYRLFLSILSK